MKIFILKNTCTTAKLGKNKCLCFKDRSFYKDCSFAVKLNLAWFLPLVECLKLGNPKIGKIICLIRS